MTDRLVTDSERISNISRDSSHGNISSSASANNSSVRRNLRWHDCMAARLAGHVARGHAASLEGVCSRAAAHIDALTHGTWPPPSCGPGASRIAETWRTGPRPSRCMGASDSCRSHPSHSHGMEDQPKCMLM